MNEIVLYQPPTRPWGSPNLSPFCAKLECYLRIAEVPYRTEPANPRKGPKGKMPYVELDGALMGDSQLIIEELERRRGAEGKPPLDADLSPRDAATAHLVRRMFDEAFYFIILAARWLPDASYAAMRVEFAKTMPRFVVPIVRRVLRKRLHAQGTGRHSEAEIAALAGADLGAVSALLGDRPFLFGDAPHVVDCSAFAFVEAVLGFPVDTAVGRAAAAYDNLIAYRARIRQRWWPDLETQAPAREQRAGAVKQG